jgi:hypothetical protein
VIQLKQYHELTNMKVISHQFPEVKMEKIRGMEYQQKTHWHTIGLTVMPKKIRSGS